MGYSFDDIEKYIEAGKVLNSDNDIRELFKGICGEFIDQFSFDKFMKYFDYVECYEYDGRYYLFQKFIYDFDDINSVIENCEISF